MAKKAQPKKRERPDFTPSTPLWHEYQVTANGAQQTIEATDVGVTTSGVLMFYGEGDSGGRTNVIHAFAIWTEVKRIEPEPVERDE